MRHAASADWASTFDFEASNQDRLAGSADSAEGIAAFFEKRKANFTGQ
jgi:enoyl-CoA hydratase/carnithine racemase